MIVTLGVFFAAIFAVSFVGAMLGAHVMWVRGYRPKKEVKDAEME
jgi:hypothetical protein